MLYFNDFLVLIEINASILSTQNEKNDSLKLPKNVGASQQGSNGVWIVTPVISQNWEPLKETAYITFNSDGSSSIRFSNKSLSNVVIIGSFAFPRNFFNIDIL